MIYCNGDSFFAGVELADDFLPEYPGLADWGFWPVQPAKEWCYNSHNDPSHVAFKTRKEQSKKILDLEYKRAFPNKIKNITGVSVINKGLGGSSMDRIVRTSISDLIKLKEEHTDITAVIGTTSHSRFEVAYPGPPAEHFLDGMHVWYCASTDYNIPNRSKLLKNVIEYKITHDETYHHLINFYKNIVLLQDFCKLNNIRLIWIDTHANVNTDWPHNLKDPYMKCEDLKNIKNYADYKATISMKNIAEKIKTNVLCPSGHWSELVHEQTAQELVNIING